MGGRLGTSSPGVGQSLWCQILLLQSLSSIAPSSSAVTSFLSWETNGEPKQVEGSL